MGVLLSSLWSRLFASNKEYKIVVVGLENAGKTTILYKLLLNDVVQTSPTIGSNVEEIKYKNITFQMWDLGGQESLRNNWSVYFIQTSAIILVVDSTDRNRISIVKEELYNRILSHKDLEHVKLLIFANKQDIKGSMTAADISKELNLQNIKNHDWHIQACCALTGEGLHQGLDWLVKKLGK